LRRHFAVVAPFGLYIPLYGSYWTLAVCSQSSDPRHVAALAIRERLFELKGPALRYYNAEIHRALFALPNNLRALLAQPESAQPSALAPLRPDPTRPRA